ncbi:hypothetical protein BN961_01081 [Afipia felis]|uniref:Uncharacterized protein n=1 Tax=Afipia felis TaxID=1035 RepID=A0A090MJP3_AFIFE|nr:hypothetical protein BN961_01081 [Afipia felis]
MIAETKRELFAHGLRAVQRAVVRIDQGFRVFLEGHAFGGQPDGARRAFHEALVQRRLQPLQFHGDRGLRGAQHLGGTGEVLQFRHQQKGLNGFDVERAHGIINICYH